MDSKARQTLLSILIVLFVLSFLLVLIGNRSSASAQASEFVVFPNAQVEFIVGPQLRMGSTLNPFPYFDTTQANGSAHGVRFPRVPPLALTGTVSVSSGSLTVSGVGTRFLSEVDPNGPAPYFNGHLTVIEGNVNRLVQVAAVLSDTEMTLTAPYPYTSQAVATANTFYSSAGNTNYDIYTNAEYYDLGLCLYALYYRSGNPTYLALARKVTDSWWKFGPINEGKVRTFDTYSLAPRNSSIGGLMLRALDGRPEMWDWIQAYTRYHFDNWVKVRINDPSLYLGIREGSYMLLYAAWLAKVLPDSYPLTAGGTARNGAQLRAQYQADAENAAINYYVRLQYPDGSWRWDDAYYTDADGGQLRGIMQPFMVGLLLHSLIDVYRLTPDSAKQATLKTSILKAVDHLYTGGPYMTHNAGIPNSSIRWRAFNYFYHGGTTVNPTKYVNGDNANFNAPDIYSVEGARQATSTIFHAFGWAYSVTGDQKYATMGDDLLDSIVGFKEDPVGDYINANDPKGFNQHYRAGGRYFAWRYGTPAPPPLAIDSTAFYVRQLYLDFLNREPDPAGFAAWQQVINNCQQGDTTCDRVHVSLAFFHSPEFQGRGYFVYRLYPVSFGRKPEYEEFTSDIAKISGFLSDAELESAKVALITEFMSRPAFVRKFNGLSDTQYVDTLLATAGLTSPNRGFWIAELRNGTRTRATVLRDISESTDVDIRYYNEACVVMQYFGYLRRDPDASYRDWIQVLNSSGNSREIVSGFINSLEYRARLATLNSSNPP